MCNLKIKFLYSCVLNKSCSTIFISSNFLMNACWIDFASRTFQCYLLASYIVIMLLEITVSNITKCQLHVLHNVFIFWCKMFCIIYNHLYVYLSRNIFYASKLIEYLSSSIFLIISDKTYLVTLTMNCITMLNNRLWWILLLHGVVHAVLFHQF
jgi:hypothetical protein